MSLKQFAIIMVCGSLVACQDASVNSTDLVSVEENDLGVTHLEIHHGITDRDRVLTIRGLDDSDREIAVATLRTGSVLYTSEPDLIPETWNDGTELAATVGDQNFVRVTPDREAHETPLPRQVDLATFVQLRAVAAAIKGEAGIWFATPTNPGEVAFAANVCDVSMFPSNVAGALQCCMDGYPLGTIHKIGAHTTPVDNYGKLGLRSYGTACRLSNGGTACGNPNSGIATCTFGPCGAQNLGVTSPNNTTSVVFHPPAVPGICGIDSSGPGTSGGLQSPAGGSDGTEAPYAGFTLGTCPYQSCCYNSVTGISEPQTGACLRFDGESCNGDYECLNGACNPVSGICGDSSTCLLDGMTGCDPFSRDGYHCCGTSTCMNGECYSHND